MLFKTGYVYPTSLIARFGADPINLPPLFPTTTKIMQLPVDYQLGDGTNRYDGSFMPLTGLMKLDE
jgi:hypothetical protein